MTFSIRRLVVAACLLTACGKTAPSAAPRIPEPAVEVAPKAPAKRVASRRATPPVAPGAAASTNADALKQALLGVAPQAVPLREPSPRAARRRIRRRQQKAKERAGDAAFAAFAEGALRSKGLSDADFQNTIGRWRGLSRCLAESASRMEDRSGALEVAFSIKPDGSVARCNVVRAGSRAAQAIASCVTRKARRMRFPSFSGSEATERTAKFVF